MQKIIKKTKEKTTYLLTNKTTLTLPNIPFEKAITKLLFDNPKFKNQLSLL